MRDGGVNRQTEGQETQVREREREILISTGLVWSGSGGRKGHGSAWKVDRDTHEPGLRWMFIGQNGLSDKGLGNPCTPRPCEARSETTGTFDDGTTVYGMSNLSRELDG